MKSVLDKSEPFPLLAWWNYFNQKKEPNSVKQFETMSYTKLAWEDGHDLRRYLPVYIHIYTYGQA